MILSLLTATAFAQKPGGVNQAALLHAGSWIAQFLGHGLAEKRAPALLDNLLGGRLSPKSLLFRFLGAHSWGMNSRRPCSFLCPSRDSLWNWLSP